MKKSPRNRESAPSAPLPQPRTGTGTSASHDADVGESPSGDLDNDPVESWSQTYDHPPAELAEALETYLASLERGETPDRAALVAKYPELAAQLEVNLEKLHLLHQVTAGILEDARQSTPRLRIEIDHPIELGDFRILREIGRGGMGVVYEAEQISLGRRVALKTLPLSGLVDPKLLARFKNEVSAAALLDHPHIVSVYAVGCDHGVHYYAMQLIEGRSMEEVIDELKGDAEPATGERARAKLNEQDAEEETVPVAQLSTQRQHPRQEFYRNVARLGIQAADALQFAHEEGVIHRDIKPSNLLLDREGNLHIADFGLARIQTGDHLTISGDIIGTLRYMSPEQLDGEVLPDERTDVYSLGLTLYELATGHAAFDASGREQLILQVQQGGPSPPSRWDRQIPRDLEKVLLRSIAARRDERYASARSFRDDLQRFWDHKPVEARRISRLRRGWRWCQRHPSTAALIALVTAILWMLAVGGPLVAWNQASIAERQRHEAYDADMAAAHVHIEYGEIDQAAILLREYRPDDDGRSGDYRSFEWYEMVDRCRRRLEATEIRFRSPCWGLATSPSGEIAVGTQFSGPAVFDSQTLQRLWPADGDPNLSVVNEGLAFSHDGRFLFSASRVKKLKVWATETGEMVHEEELDGRPSSVAVSADGIVAVGLWGKLNQGFPQSDPAPILRYRFVETGTNEITLDVLPPLHGAVGVAHDLAIAPDGQLLASGSEDRILRVWDLQSGEVQAEFSDFRGPIMTVAFSPDGTLVCGAGGNYEQAWLSGEALVYELASKRRVAAVFPEEVVYSARFVTNDKLVTGGVDRRISVWNIPDGTLREEINAHSDSIRRLAVFPDQTRVASGSADNTVRIWDLERRVPPARFTAAGSLNDVEDLAFSKDGTRLASASADRAIRIWNPHDGTLLKTLEGHRYGACGVDFSPDGTKLASLASVWPNDPENASELKIWELATGNVDTFEIPDMSYARSIAYAPSGEHVTFVGNNRLVLWNIGRKQVERELTSQVGFRVVFSRDGSLIGSVAGVWKYPSLEEVFDLGRSYNGYLFAFDIHPTNEYAATSDMQTHEIVLLSLKDGAEIRRLRGHSEVVLHVHFSHDGKRLASASQAGLVILWNLETGNEIVRYRDHQFWVWSAIFSPDDRLLASSQGGRFIPPTIMVRRAVSGEEARRILGRGR